MRSSTWVFATGEHLRREKSRSAHHLGLGRLPARVEAQRDAPVEQVHLTETADHHVLGLDVAVHHPLGVGEFQCVADLHEDPQVRGLTIFVAVLELGPKGVLWITSKLTPRHPVDALHDDEWLALRVLPEHVHRDDGGVLELARDPGLAHQIARPGRRSAITVQGLDRHLALEGSLLRKSHDSHPTGAENLPHVQLARNSALARQGHTRERVRAVRDDGPRDGGLCPFPCAKPGSGA